MIADVVAAFLADRRSRGMVFRRGVHGVASQNWVLRFAKQYQIKRHYAIVLF